MVDRREPLPDSPEWHRRRRLRRVRKWVVRGLLLLGAVVAAALWLFGVFG